MLSINFGTCCAAAPGLAFASPQTSKDFRLTRSEKKRAGARSDSRLRCEEGLTTFFDHFGAGSMCERTKLMPHRWRFKTCRTQKSARDAVSKAQQNRSPQAISMFSVRFLSRYSLPAFVAPGGLRFKKPSAMAARATRPGQASPNQTTSPATPTTTLVMLSLH